MRPTDKQEFIEYIKRKLGHPYNKIEITPEQFDDLVDDTLFFYTENVPEGQKTVYYSLDVSSGILEYDLTKLVPNCYAVHEVLDSSQFDHLLPSAYGYTKADIDFLFDLGKISSGRLVDFEVSMQNISALNKVLVPKINWEYNFNEGKFRLLHEVTDMINGTKIGLVCTVLLDYDGTSEGRMWSNKFIIEYATAMAKIQWGNNLGKFSGFTIPGGGDVNWQRILDEGKDEKQRLEEYILENHYFDPSAFGIFMA